MARKKPISEPSAFVRAQRPAQAPDTNRSNHRIDELDAQRAWEAHIDAGRIEVRIRNQKVHLFIRESDAYRAEFDHAELRPRHAAVPAGIRWNDDQAGL